MQNIIIEVEAIGKNSASNSINLLFDIENNIGNLNIKETYIVPIVHKAQRRFVPNILTDFKHGEYNTTLSFQCDKAYIDFTEIDKFQFVFVLEEGNVTTNIIDVTY